MGESDPPDRTAGTPLTTYERLRRVALEEYPALVSDAVIERYPGDTPRNLRIFFVDDGFLDVWLTETKYSYHWQSEDDFLRFDNAPHHDHVETHPHHRHEDDSVNASPLSGNPLDDFRSVVDYLVVDRLE